MHDDDIAEDPWIDGEMQEAELGAMNRQQLTAQAAREVLAHGGPDCLTDPHQATRAMSRALNAGATHDDIAAEMRRQRSA